MAKRIIVSIVSSQTVPNYLFIKEFMDEADIFLFISTRQMEDLHKTDIIYKTAGISKKQVRKILIDENELYLAKEKLDKLGWKNANHNFFVNITGGTKLMSNAVYEYFKKLNSRFFYIPFGPNNYKEIFEEKPALSYEFEFEITVDEYLKIHGIRHEYMPPIMSRFQANEIYRDARSTRFSIEEFPKRKLNKFYDGKVDLHLMTKWYEEYIYYRIKEVLKLNDQQIATGVKLFDVELEKETPFYSNDNEIDILFINKNNAYIVEVKYSIGKSRVNTTALNSYIFKLAAINKRFGIKARSAIFTHADFSTLNNNAIKNIRRRCQIAEVEFPFDRTVIDNENEFQNSLAHFIN